MEGRTNVAVNEYSVDRLLNGSKDQRDAVILSFYTTILCASAREDVISYSSNIYSTIITVLNNKKLEGLDKKTKTARADIRACLVKALEEKIPSLIKKNNLRDLRHELSGLQAIQSNVKLLQGGGGIFQMGQKSAMGKLDGFIDDIEKAIKAFPVEATLIEAARVGDLEKVKRCLDQKVNIDCQDKEGSTALYWAARNGHQRVVDYLLEKGANFNIVGKKYGQSPLDTAAFDGYVGIVQALLKANADVNQIRKEGATALYVAAQQGHDKVVQVLIDAKASINFARKDSATAIIIAAEKGHLAIVELLVTQGAVLNYLTAKKHSPLTAAINKNKLPVVTFLLKTMIRNAKLTVDASGNVIPLPEKKTIYSFIIDSLNDEKLDKTYAENGDLRKDIRACLSEALTEKVTLVIKEGQLAHLEAELAGLKAIQSQVQLLQGNGGIGFREQEKQAMIAIRGLIEKIESAIKTTTPEAALLKAAESGNLNEVIRLIEMDISIIDCQDEEGRTALYWAARSGHQRVVEYLLEKGANFNIVTKQSGQSPLDTAAFSGHLEIVQALLEANADVNQTRKDGATALYIAAEQGHDNVAQVLIEAKADINKVLEDGATALYIAAQQGHDEIVRALIDEKVDVNLAIKTGATALYIAAQQGHDKVVRALVQGKADVKQGLEDGATALYIAAHNGHTAIVDLLANENASFNQVRAWRRDAQSVEYKTPLRTASDAGHDEIVSKLKAIQDKKIRSFFPELDIKNWVPANYVDLVKYINGEKPNYQYSSELRKILRLFLTISIRERIDFLLCHGQSEHLTFEMQALETLKKELELIQKTGVFGKHAMNEIEGFIVALKEKVAHPAVMPDIKVSNVKKTFHFGGITLFDEAPSVQVDTDVESISALQTPTEKGLVKLNPSADTMQGFHSQL